MSRIDFLEGYRHGRFLIEQAQSVPGVWVDARGAVGNMRIHIRTAADRYPKDYGDGMRLAAEEGGRVKAR